MADTVRIASTLPMALHIREPEPNPEKPGLTPPLRTAVLNGTNTPEAGAAGVTEVDADLYRKWEESEAARGYLDHLRVMGADEEIGAGQFGFEPALEVAVQGEDVSGKGPAPEAAGKGEAVLAGKPAPAEPAHPAEPARPLQASTSPALAPGAAAAVPPEAGMSPARRGRIGS